MANDIAAIVCLSLWVAAGAVGIASIIGLPLGLWLGNINERVRRVVFAVVYAGMALPPVVVGLVVYLLLSRSGPLGFLGWLYTPQAMVVAQVILDLPFITGIVMTAVSTLSAELRFQMRALGATERQVRLYLLREIRPAALLALATALGRSLSEVGAVWMVGGNIQNHTRVLTTAIMLETAKGQFALALLLAAWLLAFALLVNVVIVRLQGKPAS
ncbi:MAG: ABC transporter permease [Gemmatales bacterium]|nr:MAG: ABC transporter permease [Gemmatales bacterium]